MICQKCGLDFPEKEITEECLSLFSEEELKYGLGLDWWNHENEADALSSEHPAVKKMLNLHTKVEYTWMCYECHKKEHKKNESLLQN